MHNFRTTIKKVNQTFSLKLNEDTNFYSLVEIQYASLKEHEKYTKSDHMRGIKHNHTVKI